jgi:hypothetical protein
VFQQSFQHGRRFENGRDVTRPLARGKRPPSKSLLARRAGALWREILEPWNFKLTVTGSPVLEHPSPAPFSIAKKHLRLSQRGCHQSSPPLQLPTTFVSRNLTSDAQSHRESPVKCPNLRLGKTAKSLTSLNRLSHAKMFSDTRAADLPRWLAWYNQQRPHGSLGRRTPAQPLAGQPDQNSSVDAPADASGF